MLPLPPPNAPLADNGTDAGAAAPALAALEQGGADADNAIQGDNVPAEAVALASLEQEAADDSEAEPTEGAKKAPKQRVAYRALEIAAQIQQVQEWLTQGKRPNQIRALCAQEWGLGTRAAEQRMQDARRQMVVDANVYDRQEKVGQMLQQLEQVLEQALTMRQGSNAIGALRLQADLLQLLSRQS